MWGKRNNSLPNHSHLHKQGASLLDRYENTQQMLEDAFQVKAKDFVTFPP